MNETVGAPDQEYQAANDLDYIEQHTMFVFLGRCSYGIAEPGCPRLQPARAGIIHNRRAGLGYLQLKV